MATQLQIRRGTTAQMNAFTGAEGELAVNTSTDTVHVHDGATAGGFALAKADGSNIGTYAGSFTTLAASGAVTLSSTLAVTGTATMGGLTVDLADNAGVLLQSPNDSSTAFLKFGDATSADSGSISYDHFSDALRFKTNNTERLRILSTGGITFNGDTAAANALDDYEEGTWTPTLNMSSGSVTYSSQLGQYTKIGNQVTLTGWIYINSISSPSGALSITVPFTASSTLTRPATMIMANNTTGVTGNIAMWVNPNTKNMYLQIVNNADLATLDGSNMASNTELYLNITYITT